MIWQIKDANHQLNKNEELLVMFLPSEITETGKNQWDWACEPNILCIGVSFYSPAWSS